MNTTLQFVISSPSGCGKTTIANAVLNKDRGIIRSISCTTREKRKTEEEGRDYFFITKQKFKSMIEGDEFLEYAQVFDHFYGTPVSNLKTAENKGVDIMYVIDWQGGLELMESVKKNIISIFILPPSIEELKKRLEKRNLDSSKEIEKRLSQAVIESSHCTSYDYVIVNDDLLESIKKVESIIMAERLRTVRQNMKHVLEKL